MNRWVSLGLLLLVIALVGLLFYRVMIGFFLPLFLAAVLVVVFRPLHRWMVVQWKGRVRLAAATTTLVIACVVLLPLIGVATLAAMEARSLIARLGDKNISQRISDLRSTLGLDYNYATEIRYLEASIETLRAEAMQGATAKGDPAATDRLLDVVDQLETRLENSGEDVERVHPLRNALRAFDETTDNPALVGTLRYQLELRHVAAELRLFKSRLLKGEFNVWLKELANPTSDEMNVFTERIFAGAPGFLRSIGGATTGVVASVALGLGIMVLSVYFFLTDGPMMVAALMRLSPLDDRQERELLDEFDRASRAVVAATLLSALAQGVLAGIGFQVAGVGSVFLLSLATFMTALIPFVGAATIWVPVCIGLYMISDRPVAATLLAIYGAGIVSMADNVVKPIVLHGQSNLHPLLGLLSVLGGISALGPIGILVGPMIVVFLQTLLNILHRELAAIDRGAA